MKDDAETPLPWALFAAELVGTAVLIAVGLSIVIVMFGAGSPLPQLIPSETLRRVITGLLFGSVGGLIAVSPVGRVSGAHINPAVTFGFWLMGKLDLRVGIGYVAAQLIGATIGAVPLLAWGEIGRSVGFGATVPGTGYSTVEALAGEAATTFGLVVALCFFLGFRELRHFTPAMMDPRAGNRVRSVGWMVDLLGRSAARDVCGDGRRQCARRPDRSGQALPLQPGSRRDLSPDESQCLALG